MTMVTSVKGPLRAHKGPRALMGSMGPRGHPPWDVGRPDIFLPGPTFTGTYFYRDLLTEVIPGISAQTYFKSDLEDDGGAAHDVLRELDFPDKQSYNQPDRHR